VPRALRTPRVFGRCASEPFKGHLFVPNPIRPLRMFHPCTHLAQPSGRGGVVGVLQHRRGTTAAPRPTAGAPPGCRVHHGPTPTRATRATLLLLLLLMLMLMLRCPLLLLPRAQQRRRASVRRGLGRGRGRSLRPLQLLLLLLLLWARPRVVVAALLLLRRRCRLLRRSHVHLSSPPNVRARQSEETAADWSCWVSTSKGGGNTRLLVSHKSSGELVPSHSNEPSSLLAPCGYIRLPRCPAPADASTFCGQPGSTRRAGHTPCPKRIIQIRVGVFAWSA
jgi:hypothetical protein